MAGYGGDKSHAKVLSSEKYCYILDPEESEYVGFQLMPDSISESKAAMYNEVPIVGRSLPQLGYASSTARTVGLNLQFVALEREGKYTTEWVKTQVRWLEAKTYPRYLDGFTFPPPGLRLIVGDVIGLQCVMTACTTTWLGPWDVSDEKASPFRAMVDIQLQEYGQNDVDDYPFSHDDAMQGINQLGGDAPEDAGSYVDIPLGV